MRQGLDVDEVVGARRANRLLVQAFGVELAALQAGDLRSDQRGAALEILRSVTSPVL